MLTTQAEQLMQQYQTQFMQDSAPNALQNWSPLSKKYCRAGIGGFQMKTNHLIRRWH